MNLTDELDRFVEAHVNTGQYANASEVFRAGLRALGQQEQLYQGKLDRIRSTIDEGDRAPDAAHSLDSLVEELELTTIQLKPGVAQPSQPTATRRAHSH